LTVGIKYGQDWGEIIGQSYGRITVKRKVDPFVRVPDFVLKSVGFVGEVQRTSAGVFFADLYASGFFVGVACSDERVTQLWSCYFVTAKHVANQLAQKEIYFLVNKVGGGVTPVLQVVGNEWWTHPGDPAIDVAVIQIARQDDADIVPLGLEIFGTADTIKLHNIGIGDDVFFPGLFTPAPGIGEMRPIVRHGNIAMMPTQQIQTRLGYANVYLVEARSIGGLSGSPVFARPTIDMHLQGIKGAEKLTVHALAPDMILLGLMHGHWDVQESEMNNPTIAHDKRGVNLGIGIVVPAAKIMEVINQPMLKKFRNDLEQTVLTSKVPGTDSAKSDDDPAFTQKDFEDALKKASRKTAPKKT
jgi:hypothetical protein